MIPNQKQVVLESEGVEASSDFGISQDGLGMIINILRNQIYSDKPMAIVREYSTNAMDANVEAGKPDTPILVTFPTLEDPNLRIRDYGLGMTDQQVLYFYTKYGASSKRNSNSSTGMLGIGSKCGFAYGDMFLITSWNGGKQTNYTASLDESKRGKLLKMTEDPCDPSETGIEICIPIKQKDFQEIIQKGLYLFGFFRIRPIIRNAVYPTEPKRLSTESGYWNLAVGYNSGEAGWQAIMGNIPYRVDLSQFNDEEGNDLIPEEIKHFNGGLYMPMGSVEFNAGREGLEYTEATKAAVLTQFNKLVEERREQTRAIIDSKATDSWSKRLLVVDQGPFKTAFRKEWVGQDQVTLPPHPDFFFVSLYYHNDQEAKGVNVNGSACIVIHDDPKRNVRGFSEITNRYGMAPMLQINPAGGKTLDQILLMLPEYLKEAKLDGIPITHTKDLKDWYDPEKDRYVKPTSSHTPRAVNTKHKANVFTLNWSKLKSGRGFKYRPYSDYWSTGSRSLDDKAIYTVVYEFLPTLNTGGPAIADSLLALYDTVVPCGISMPDIYGYKQVQLDRMLAKNLPVGVPVLTWLPRFVENLMNTEPDFYRAVQHRAWMYYMHLDGAVTDLGMAEKMLQAIELELGADHAFATVFRNFVLTGYEPMERVGQGTYKKVRGDVWDEFINQFDGQVFVTTAQQMWLEIRERYSFIFGPPYGGHGERPKYALHYLASHPPTSVEYQGVINYIRALDYYDVVDRTSDVLMIEQRRLMTVAEYTQQLCDEAERRVPRRWEDSIIRERAQGELEEWLALHPPAPLPTATPVDDTPAVPAVSEATPVEDVPLEDKLEDAAETDDEELDEEPEDESDGEADDELEDVVVPSTVVPTPAAPAADRIKDMLEGASRTADLFNGEIDSLMTLLGVDSKQP